MVKSFCLLVLLGLSAALWAQPLRYLEDALPLPEQMADSVQEGAFRSVALDDENPQARLTALEEEARLLREDNKMLKKP